MITKRRTSLHQDNSAPLDLVDSDPHRRSAMRTLSRGLAGNSEAQVRLVPRIQSLLKCDELPQSALAQRTVRYHSALSPKSPATAARHDGHVTQPGSQGCNQGGLY